MQKLEFTLKVWRQKNNSTKGHFQTYQAKNIESDMSFLEMLDHVNEDIMQDGHEPIAFDSDCREGICGACSMVINGIAHGPEQGNTTCQLFMRKFKNGQTITIEPFRAKAFPAVKDLVVDRSAFDKVLQSGGFVSVNTGCAVEANSIPVCKENAEKAFENAACIGCGACVAACKNASAMLFVGAKISHLNNLPQGAVEHKSRVINMVSQMDKEGFGACSNTYECEAVCPKSIKRDVISQMNFSYIKTGLLS